MTPISVADLLEECRKDNVDPADAFVLVAGDGCPVEADTLDVVVLREGDTLSFGLHVSSSEVV